MPQVKIKKVGVTPTEEQLKQYRKDQKEGRIHRALKLRYGKLVFAADMDPDGSHIKGLLINAIRTFWPKLFDYHHVYMFRTPLLKVWVGKDELWFYDLTSFGEWQQKNTKPYRSKYYKGLGSSTAADFKEYFKKMDENLIRIEFNDAEDQKSLELVFSKELGMSDERKKWLGVEKDVA